MDRMFTTHEFSEKSLAGWARNPFQGAVLILSCNSAPELSPIALSQNPMAALVKDGMHRSRLLYKFSTNIRDAHRLNGGKRHLCGDSVCLGWQRSRIDVTWPLTSPCTCASVLRRLSDPRPRRIHLRPRRRDGTPYLTQDPQILEENRATERASLLTFAHSSGVLIFYPQS